MFRLEVAVICLWLVQCCFGKEMLRLSPEMLPREIRVTLLALFSYFTKCEDQVGCKRRPTNCVECIFTLIFSGGDL